MQHWHRISWRKVGNRKPKSAAERTPALKRWHARYKHHLQQPYMPENGGLCNETEGATHHDKIYNVDHVPFQMLGGDASYKFVDTDKVWVKGGASGATTHRDATLQLCVRTCRPIEGAKFRGQMMPGLIFRGQGNITQAERDEYNTDVYCAFNNCAWATNDYSMFFADKLVECMPGFSSAQPSTLNMM